MVGVVTRWAWPWAGLSIEWAGRGRGLRQGKPEMGVVYFVGLVCGV